MFTKVFGFQKLLKHFQQKESLVILNCLLILKFAVCVKKNECIVSHLPLGNTGNFAKTIFYFLRTDKYSICEVEITGKLVKLGAGKGMQVPCELKLTGRSKFVNILQNSLKTKK